MSKGTSLILILLSVAIFYTFTSPQYGDAQKLSTQAGEYRDVIDNVSRIDEARASLAASYQAIPAAEKDRLAKALPDNVDVVGLSRDLDTISAKYGIAVKSVQVDSQTQQDRGAVAATQPSNAPYDKALVSFTFVSNYANFMKFLADLEKSLRLMDVKSASFQTAQSGVYEHKITVQTYWLK